MRAQRLHHNDDDADWDSNRASDADVDGNNDDGGRRQSQQIQQQPSNAATKTTRVATRVVHATVHYAGKSTAPGSSPTVLTATVSAHPLVF